MTTAYKIIVRMNDTATKIPPSVPTPGAPSGSRNSCLHSLADFQAIMHIQNQPENFRKETVDFFTLKLYNI